MNEDILQLQINHLSKKLMETESENELLKETILNLKDMQRKQTQWILQELGFNPVDAEQLIKESIIETTTEMP